MTQSFGKTLKHIREKTGVSISELARLINKSKGYLSDLENDNNPPPSLFVILSIAKALNADKKILLMAAGKEPEYATQQTAVADFLRMSVEEEYDDEDWKNLRKIAEIAKLGRGGKEK